MGASEANSRDRLAPYYNELRLDPSQGRHREFPFRIARTGPAGSRQSGRVPRDGVGNDGCRGALAGAARRRCDKEAHGEFESECPGYSEQTDQARIPDTVLHELEEPVVVKASEEVLQIRLEHLPNLLPAITSLRVARA